MSRMISISLRRLSAILSFTQCDYLCSEGFEANNRMISCTAEEGKPSPVYGGSPSSSGPDTEMENHRAAEAGCPVPEGGGIHHDQCALVDDMNHVAGEGEGRMDAEEPQTQGRRRRKDVPFQRGGQNHEGGGGRGGGGGPAGRNHT